MADTEPTPTEPTPDPETNPTPDPTPEPTPEPEPTAAPTPAPAGSTVNRNKYERDLGKASKMLTNVHFHAFRGAKCDVCGSDLRF